MKTGVTLLLLRGYTFLFMCHRHLGAGGVQTVELHAEKNSLFTIYPAMPPFLFFSLSLQYVPDDK